MDITLCTSVTKINNFCKQNYDLFSCRPTYVRHKISISDLVLHRTSIAHKMSLKSNNKSDYDMSM